MIGIREYAKKHGNGFHVVDEEDFSQLEVSENQFQFNVNANPTSKSFSLFAYPAEDNFAGVKYPLEWIEAVQKGRFNPVGCNHKKSSLESSLACLTGCSRLRSYKSSGSISHSS